MHKNAYFLHEKLFEKTWGKSWHIGIFFVPLCAFPTENGCGLA